MANVMTPQNWVESMRHVYGGKCGREKCVWCDEWVKMKKEPMIAKTNKFLQSLGKGR